MAEFVVYDDIISRNATITFDGKRPELHFVGFDKIGRYTIQGLNVMGVDSTLDFSSGKTKLFLDDLWIGGMGDLFLEGFVPASGDGLFVRKTSVYLEDALAKIRFGNTSGKVGVRDYNWEYWEIGIGADFRPLPEPAVYDTVFSLGALGFVAWRRRRRRPSTDLLWKNHSWD